MLRDSWNAVEVYADETKLEAKREWNYNLIDRHERHS